MALISIKDIDISNKVVFIRCDFNVPQDEFGNISDDRRIKSAIPTIRYCLDHDAKVILGSHLGRPKEVSDKYSLQPVAKRLERLLTNVEVIMAKDVIGDDAKEKAKNIKKGQILLLENLRFIKGETKNDEEMAKELASMCDVFCNDAFGVCHRAHASVEAITRFAKVSCAGFLLQKEFNFAQDLLKSPARPFVAVVGGSKVSGKLQALHNLLPKIDKLIIGGGMAFTFLKANGINVGNSIVEEDLINDAKEIMQKAKELDVKLYLPVDILAAQTFSNDSVVKKVPSQEIPNGWMGLDIGPASSLLFKEVLSDAETIWWNGPMGVFEFERFSKGSIKMSHYISDSYAVSVAGGGDTADVINRADNADDFSFISTGGGASLELIEGKELPAIKPLISKEDE